MPMKSENLPPSGWYTDPNTPSLLRYWDGSNWTEHRHDKENVPFSSQSDKVSSKIKKATIINTILNKRIFIISVVMLITIFGTLMLIDNSPNKQNKVVTVSGLVFCPSVYSVNSGFSQVAHTYNKIQTTKNNLSIQYQAQGYNLYNLSQDGHSAASASPDIKTEATFSSFSYLTQELSHKYIAANKTLTLSSIPASDKITIESNLSKDYNSWINQITPLLASSKSSIWLSCSTSIEVPKVSTPLG